MAHTQKQRLPKGEASQNWVIRVVLVWVLCIALVFPIGVGNAAMFHDVAPLQLTSVDHIDEGFAHDAGTKMVTHCGQHGSCGSTMLIVRPLNFSAGKSPAIFPVSGAKALSWISGPPGHPPKATTIT